MKLFYKLISIIFQPFLIPSFGMLLLMNMDIFTALPLLWRWIAIVGTFIFTGVFPIIPILLLMRRGEVKDLFMSKREERTMPYLFTLMAYVFWVLFMGRTMQFPLFIISMGIGSAFSILIITIINLKWKISAHLAGMGSLTAAIFAVSYRMAINPLGLFVFAFALSTLVALSRIELKAHTPAQTLAGFVLGFVSVFVSCFLV